MANNAQDLKDLLDDPKVKSGPVQDAILDGVGSEILDPIEDDIVDAESIRDPNTTTRPEDLRAKYAITDPITGAALATRIQQYRRIGDPDYLKEAVENYLSTAYTFVGTPAVTVMKHRDLPGARWADWHTVSVRIPVQDSGGTPIPLDDAGLEAEIERVLPKWYYAVTNSLIARSAPYIKRLTSEHLYNAKQIEVIFPDDVFASSEYERVADRESKDVDWFDTVATLRRIDNIIDGEDEEHPTAEDLGVTVEASSTHIDFYKTYAELLTVDTALLGGFESDEPIIDGIGITAIAAKERTRTSVFDVTDKNISQGQLPTINLLEPPDQVPITIDQELRLITNDKDDTRIPTGRQKIFHDYLTADDDRLTDLSGRKVRVLVQPLEGGPVNQAELALNPARVFQQFVAADENRRGVSSGTLNVEFAREYIDGPDLDELDKIPKKEDTDETLTFLLAVGGVSAGGTATIPGGNTASPGFIGVPIKNPGSVTGVTSHSGFPSIGDPDNEYLNVQKMHIEALPATVNIAIATGGSGPTYVQGLVPINARPEYDMLPNAGECRTFGVTVANFFDIINFPTGGATPGVIDLAWRMEFEVEALYDHWILEDPTGTTVQDPQTLDFSPDQTFRVTDVNLSGHEAFVLDQDQYVDPEPGWTDSLNNPGDNASIQTHRLRYDANAVPVGSQLVKGFARMEISEEEVGENLSLTIPIPTGLRCDWVEIRFGTQIFIINQTDPNIQAQGGGPVFKSVHLDTAIDIEHYTQYSLNTILLFYEPLEIDNDLICEAYAHYVKGQPVLMNLDIEDLTSLSFSTYSELPIALVEHNLGDHDPGAIFGEYFTEKDTGDIVENPIDKFITGGVIFYWKERLPDEGLLAQVWVTYGDYVDPGDDPLPKDMKILSISVPEGDLEYFEIINLPYEKLYYVDEIRIIHEVIAGYKIQTLEIHFDTNAIEEDGVFVEVFANYGLGSPMENSAEELLSFSCKEFKLVEANFAGLTVKRLYYDTPELGVLPAPLPEPMQVTNVLVVFDDMGSTQEKVEVVFKPTYLKPLKEAVFPIRPVGPRWFVTAIDVTGITPREVWVEGEYDKFHNINYGSVLDYKPQRLQNLRVYYYDNDLSTDEGEDIQVNVTAREIINSRFNPFRPGVGKWSSPSSQDEQYRIDMQGVTINRIVIDGDTGTPEPIIVNDKGFEKPFRNGTDYEPRYLLLYYAEIRSIEIYFDVTQGISNNPRQNVIFDDDTYWQGETSGADERVEIKSPRFLFNQLLVDKDDSSVGFTQVRIQAARDERDFLTATFAPVTRAIDSVADVPAESTMLPVTSTTNMVPYSILELEASGTWPRQYVRILEIVDATTLRIDPLEYPVQDATAIHVVGWDFGDPIESEDFVIHFLKGGAIGSAAIRRIWPRLEQRLLERANGRNVLYDDGSYWSSEGGEDPAGDASLRILFDEPIRFNRLAISEEISSEFQVWIVDVLTEQERQVFLAKDLSEYGDVYLDAEKVDDPLYRPDIVKTQMIVLKWDTLPRNPETGLYQTKMVTCIPQFIHDPSNSSFAAALDNNIRTRLMLDAAPDTTTSRDLLCDLGNVFPVDRLRIVTQSLGARLDIYGALGNEPNSFSFIATIPDIGAPKPGTVITAVLTGTSGAGTPNPDRVNCVTTGFTLGRYVNVSDDTWPFGEARKIVGIAPGYLTLEFPLGLTYTVAQNGVAIQSNILCPGTYFPFITGAHCRGDHVRGPADFRDAFIIPSTDVRFLRMQFSNIPIASDTSARNLMLSEIDAFEELAIP